ncbi:MAG: hypothetical protein ACE5GX_00540 [Thermoanaerobaculia bacterium]
MSSNSIAVHTIIKWSLSALLAYPAQALAPDGIAITGGTVITMADAGVLTDYTILVRGETIFSMGPSESTVVPAGFDRVDARGKFVLPGLVDMHVHLSGRSDLLGNLRYGVTSVLQMSGQRGQITDFLRLRDQLERGEISGPRLFLTGPMFDRIGLTSQKSAYARAGHVRARFALLLHVLL